MTIPTSSAAIFPLNTTTSTTTSKKNHDDVITNNTDDVITNNTNKPTSAVGTPTIPSATVTTGINDERPSTQLPPLPPQQSLSSSSSRMEPITTSTASVVSSSSTTGVPFFYPLKGCLSSKNLFLIGEDEMLQPDGTATTATTTASSASSKMKKSVSFHQIEIREHERTISDNPSVSSGIGLGIGWDSIDSLQCTVSEWEQYRPPRRSKSALIIPSHVREQILKDECHITSNQFQESMKQITKIKVSRQRASKDPESTIDDFDQHIIPPSGGPPIRRRRSFMGLSRLLRPITAVVATNKQQRHTRNMYQHHAMIVDQELQQLMEQSIRVEQIRQQQQLLYIQSLQQEQQLNTGTYPGCATSSVKTNNINDTNYISDDPTSEQTTTTHAVFNEQQQVEVDESLNSTVQQQYVSSTSPPPPPPLLNKILSSPSPFAVPVVPTTNDNNNETIATNHHHNDDDMEDDEALEF